MVYPRGVGATTSFFTVFLGAEKIQVPSSAQHKMKMTQISSGSFFFLDNVRNGNDYSSVATEVRVQYLLDNQNTYDKLADEILDFRDGNSGFVNIDELDKSLYKKIRHTVNDRGYVTYYDDNACIKIDLYGKTDKFRQCSFIYIEKNNDEVLKRRFFDRIEWDDERNCYAVYNDANYHALIQVTDNWYLDQEAFYDDPAFRRPGADEN